MSAVFQIGVPVVLFTGFVLLLSGVVLAARAWLLPSGLVTIGVNGGRQRFEVDPGNKLLWTLADNGIYLPAACGGRGTCGQCRVTVEQGGRPLLPTEAAHINGRDAAHGVRLACMLDVRAALDISIADELLETRRWICTVRSNRSIAPFLKELVLTLPERESLSFEAGGYVLLEAPSHRVVFRELEIERDYAEDWARSGLLDLVSETTEPVVRAYSLANPPQEPDIATLVVRIAGPPPHAPPGTPPGKASSYIFALRPGDSVTISGPFGEFHAADTQREMIAIAGGAGIAPIRSIILDQLARGTGRRIGFWYGARDLRELCYREEFDALAAKHANFEWTAALSDPRAGNGWGGPTGLIHSVVYERYLKGHPTPDEAEYYLCGPPLMSAAVVHMLDDLGVERDSIFFDDFGA